MTAAVKEKSESSLFVKREIDDYNGQDTYKFRIYVRINHRDSNSEAWESITNKASACCMSLSRARLTLQILNLAEIAQ